MGKKKMGPEIRKRRQGKKETPGDEIKRIRWAADEKEDWGREKEMELDHKKVETMVPQVVEGVWKGGIREDANKKDMGSHHRSQGGVQGQQSTSASTL